MAKVARRFGVKWVFVGISCMVLILIWFILGFSVSTDIGLLIPSRTTQFHILSYTSTMQEYADAFDLHYKPILHPNVDEKIPYYVPLGELLQNWNPDDISEEKWLSSLTHPSTGHGIIRLDYQNKLHATIALEYRNLELPFILYNVPTVAQARSQFGVDSLLKHFGSFPRMVDKSSTNHFMYYTAKNSLSTSLKYPSWKPPQLSSPMTFSAFLKLAEKAESFGPIVRNESLYYMTMSAGEGLRTPWIQEALPIFSLGAPAQSSFFIVDSQGYKGVNCRFGMKGVVAAAHYDGGRNFVAMIRGRKRYILLPPEECGHLELLPRGHPSARHSRVDWADLQQMSQYPLLYNANATEVVLSQGELLYIPSYWFHYIVSQDASIQCNARSGSPEIGRDAIRQCGFYSSSGQTRKRDTPDGGDGESDGSSGANSRSSLRKNRKRKFHIELES